MLWLIALGLFFFTTTLGRLALGGGLVLLAELGPLLLLIYTLLGGFK